MKTTYSRTQVGVDRWSLQDSRQPTFHFPVHDRAGYPVARCCRMIVILVHRRWSKDWYACRRCFPDLYKDWQPGDPTPTLVSE